MSDGSPIPMKMFVSQIGAGSRFHQTSTVMRHVLMFLRLTFGARCRPCQCGLDDSMAGDDDGDGISAIGRAYRTRRFRIPHRFHDLPVGVLSMGGLHKNPTLIRIRSCPTASWPSNLQIWAMC